MIGYWFSGADITVTFDQTASQLTIPLFLVKVIEFGDTIPWRIQVPTVPIPYCSVMERSFRTKYGIGRQAFKACCSNPGPLISPLPVAVIRGRL